MNNYVIGSVCFVVGAALGAVAGIRWTTKKIDAKYEALVQEELESIRETNDRRVGEFTRAMQEYSPREFTLPEESEDDSKEDDFEFPTEVELANGETRPSLAGVDFPSRTLEVEAEKDIPKPYPISFDQMSSEKIMYEKVTLSFYEEDQTLVDEREELIDNEEELLGTKALDILAEMPVDTTAFYIRNENMMMDFEVVVVQGSYAETAYPNINGPS